MGALSGVAPWLAVAFGGAIGALGRYAVFRAAVAVLGPHFPWGTLFVNVFGSAAMGAIVVWLARTEPHSANLRLFLAVGLLGAFTTFSTFALDAITLYRDRSGMIAALYVGGSVVGAIAGLLAGIAIARRVL